MSPGVLTCLPDQEVIEAARSMLANQRKWLVVVDDAGSAMGLVNRQVLLKAFSAD
jgi:CBS domain-containing protein